jgi:C1A family cysteine protease
VPRMSTSRFIPPGLGWLRDLPDPRDYLADDPRVRKMLHRLKRPPTGRAAPPPRVDWRDFFAPVEDQQTLHASAAHACVALADYFERRAHGTSREGSPLFLYKMTRRLLNGEGDRGAGLRSTLKAMKRFGIPPQRFCPYDVTRFDEEPAPFLFAYASEYLSVHYVRLDRRRAGGPEVLAAVKAFLAAGFASALGFTVFNSLTADPDIPAPTTFDSVRGGQVVVAAGYDDGRRIRSTRGALLVRSSWGPAWGENGYGWLPYAYLEDALAADVWTLLEPSWIDSGEFERPA